MSRRFGKTKAALVMASLALLAPGSLIAQEAPGGRAGEALLARVHAALASAEAELERVTSVLAAAIERDRAGIAQPGELERARFEHRAVEVRIRTIRFDEVEIRATGRAPRNGPAAPLVDGRDLVTERLELQRELARARLRVAEREWDEVQRRVRLGALDPAEGTLARAALEHARGELRLVGLKLGAREEFVGGGATAEASPLPRVS